MVTDEHVSDTHRKFVREVGDLLDPLRYHLIAQNQVSQQSPFVGSVNIRLPRVFPDLPDIVKQHTRYEQISVKFGVVLANRFSQVQNRANVLYQTANPVVVKVKGRRCVFEGIGEFRVVKERAQQRTKVGILHALNCAGHFLPQRINVSLRSRHQV
jgi:hypothetical protein